MSPAVMTTLSDVLKRLAVNGYTEHFSVIGNRLRALESGKAFGAQEVVIRQYDRFEGISDPGDMSIVYAIEGPGGTRGTLVDAFGVYSNPVISEFLHNVRIKRLA
jgi:hypothetical protein